MNRFDKAIEIVKWAVESDEETAARPFDKTTLEQSDYPIHGVHRVLNQSHKITQEILDRHPNGALAQIVRASLDMITDPEGSYCYSNETARAIYGLKEQK